MCSERKEAFMRIIVLIVSGIVLGLWGSLIRIIFVIHWIVTIFSGKRNRNLANFSEMWNTQIYIFLRYINFVNNERPFPFRPLTKNMTAFEKTGKAKKTKK